MVSIVVGVGLFTLLWQIDLVSGPSNFVESPPAIGLLSEELVGVGERPQPSLEEQARVAVLFLSPSEAGSTLWAPGVKNLVESSNNLARLVPSTDTSSLQSLFITSVEEGAEYLLLVEREPPPCPGLIDKMVDTLKKREGLGVVSTALGGARMIHKSHAEVFSTIMPSSLSAGAAWQWLRLVYGGDSSSIIDCNNEESRPVSLTETDLHDLTKELTLGCIDLSLHQKAQGKDHWDNFRCGELKGSPSDPVSHQLEGASYTLADSPKPEGGWLAFKEVLASKADKDKVVLVAFTNDGFLSMTLNWVYYVQKLGLEYLLIALDDTVYQELQDYNIPTFYDPSMTASSGEEIYATSAYVTITVLKIRYALLITSLGYHTFLCDTDIVILKVWKIPICPLSIVITGRRLGSYFGDERKLERYSAAE